jgi:hypothetical protein
MIVYILVLDCDCLVFYWWIPVFRINVLLPSSGFNFTMCGIVYIYAGFKKGRRSESRKEATLFLIPIGRIQSPFPQPFS